VLWHYHKGGGKGDAAREYRAGLKVFKKEVDLSFNPSSVKRVIQSLLNGGGISPLPAPKKKSEYSALLLNLGGGGGLLSGEILQETLVQA